MFASFALSFLLLISPFMSTEVWGQLPKAQDDDETIEEAINRIVGEHNDDPVAHSSAGQAIAVHREDTMIDHPAGSIPFDKKIAGNMQYKDYFTADVSAYDPDGTVTCNGGILTASVFHVSGGESTATVRVPLFQRSTWPSKELVVQFLANFNWNTTSDKLSLVWGGIAPSVENGFGLKVLNGNLYAVLYFASGEVISAPLTYTKAHWATFRIHIVPAEGVARFYLNAELVAELSLGSTQESDFSSLLLDAHATLTTYADVSISMLDMGFSDDLIY